MTSAALTPKRIDAARPASAARNVVPTAPMRSLQRAIAVVKTALGGGTRYLGILSRSTTTSHAPTSRTKATSGGIAVWARRRNQLWRPDASPPSTPVTPAIVAFSVCTAATLVQQLDDASDQL